MIWLVVLGLGLWCVFQHQRLTELGERLARLSEELARLAARPANPTPTWEAIIDEAAECEPADVSPPAATPPQPTAAAPALRAEISTPPKLPEPSPEARPRVPARSISDWLSENGLAWIGGGALALGGLMLVAYAAERGLFTPAMRVGSAAVLGLIVMGAGEALRRGVGAKAAPNLLVAALTTAAGAAMLYAAVWAAYLLYHFISPGAAGVLLAAVSFALLALALLHGQALGLLAVVAAYAVPVVSGGGGWGGTALDGFILLILATGTAVAGLRRWGRVGACALAGAGLWALARLASPDLAGVTLIAAAAPFLALGAVVYARRAGRESIAGQTLFPSLPAAAVVGASVLALLLWSMSGADAPRDAMLASGAIILVIAAGVRILGLDPTLLWVPAAVAVFAAILSSVEGGPSDRIAWLPPILAALALAGFDSARRSDRKRAAALAGAGGGALALTFAAVALARTWPRADWAVDAVFAVLFAIGATLLARRSEEPRTDWTAAPFIAAAAETTGLALHASVDGRLAPTAYALLSLGLAALAARIKWRGLAESAAVAALASLAALLAHPIAGEALTGAIGWLPVTLASGAAALIQLAAWRLLKTREDVQASAEAISTTALVSALLGAFLALQTFGWTGRGAERIDAFTEASLRTALMLTTGLILILRGFATRWGRTRALVILALGAAHGLFLQGLVLHPWWGWSAWTAPRAVVGPPLVDGLLLGLLAPALLLAAAARRGRGSDGERGIAGPALSAALAFLAIWLMSELRRLFHGPELTVGPFGYAETAAYGAALLGLALALETSRARLAALAGSTGALFGVIGAIAWIALAATLWLFGFVASPWWGPLDGELSAPVLLAGLYVMGCLFSAGLARTARRSDRKPLAKAALIAAGVEVFALLTLAIRYGFHGAAMRAPLHEAGLETWTFSAAWALYGLVALAVGASRRDLLLRGLGLTVLLGTTAKVFLFDLARLEGVVRAASFLALGAVLLVGALAARRFAPTPPRNEPVVPG